MKGEALECQRPVFGEERRQALYAYEQYMCTMRGIIHNNLEVLWHFVLSRGKDVYLRKCLLNL